MKLNYEGFEDNMLVHQKRIYPDTIGDRYIFRFENDYGALVADEVYGCDDKQGLWELSVLIFTGDKWFEFLFCDDTPITNGISEYLTNGAFEYLTDTDVREILQKIKEL